MPERRFDLLERLARADSFARMPANFAESPPEMDTFSEILSGVKLNGAVFFNAEFSAPWGVSQPDSKIMAARIAPQAEQLILYHLVTEGRAVVELSGGESLALEPGDIVVFPRGDAHHL